MIALIQRVNWAEVKVSGQSVGKINHGLLALVAIEKKIRLPPLKKC